MGEGLMLGGASADDDFRAARRRAALGDVLARLTGRRSELLSYEEVRRAVKGMESARREVPEQVPLDAIVGSVGRYKEFTREFLPRHTVRGERWTGIKKAMGSLKGVPPIEVYRIGDAYFVQDGNHRVSVAKRMGLSHIDAYVTEVRTRIPLAPGMKRDELIVKAEHADFLERTGLDRRRPDTELALSVPGKYRVLIEHIDVHRYYMGLERRREIPFEDAAADWYDGVYLPAARAIRERGLLRDFPELTECDLYLCLAQHRAELEEDLSWDVSADTAADDLAERFDLTLHTKVLRVRERSRDPAVEVTEAARDGEAACERPEGRPGPLFADLLVAIDGQASGWTTLAQALIFARQEGARLYGLHVVREEEEVEGPAALAVREEFERRRGAAGVAGRLAVDAGTCAERTCARARWADLVVAGLAHLGPQQRLIRLGSEFRTLIRRSPRPLLVVPGEPRPLARLLLAYDGSEKADEALYVTAYLARRWGAAVAVVTAAEAAGSADKTQRRARDYLQAHGIGAEALKARGPAAASILDAASAAGSDLILMGGYGHAAPFDRVMGSAVDAVLRAGTLPVLVCR